MIDTLGSRVRSLRLSKGLKQRELAVDLGCSTGLIATIETGRQLPGMDLTIKISKYFDVSLDWLVFGEEYIGKLSPEENELLREFRADKGLSELLSDVFNSKKKLVNWFKRDNESFISI